MYFVYDWDWVKAEAELKRGVELSPNGRDALSPYANFLRRMKRLEEARQQMARCLEVDPLSPLEVLEAALLHLDAGEPQKAEQLVMRVSDTAPDYRPSLWGLANIYLSTGRLNQAIGYLEKTVQTTRRDRLALPALGVAYARAGRLDDARRVLNRLLATPEVAQAAIAQLYVSLGQNEEGVRWWQRALAARDPRMVWLRLYSADHPLWNDPRFQELIRQMNFPQ
jgi:tetratricopeptide (TPR) repeat protein